MRSSLFGPLLCVVLGTSLMPVVPKADAQDRSVTKTNRYIVHGQSMREIRSAITAARPRMKLGEHDALTDWKIEWRMGNAVQGGVCRLSSFSTTTTITITLPLWIASTNASPELIRAWSDYIAALELHEEGHVRLVRSAALEMRQRVQSVAVANDCAALKQKVEVTAESVLTDLRRKHKEYDERTHHGQTQRAVTPGGRYRRTPPVRRPEEDTSFR